MQIFWNKRKLLHKKKRSNAFRIDLGQQHGPLYHRTPIWQTGHYVTMFYKNYTSQVCDLFPIPSPTPTCTIYLLLAAIFLKLYSVQRVGGAPLESNDKTDQKAKGFGAGGGGQTRILFGKIIWQVFLFVLIYVRILWSI